MFLTLRKFFPQSEILSEYPQITSLKPVMRVFDVRLEMPNNSKEIFGFVVNEISRSFVSLCIPRVIFIHLTAASQFHGEIVVYFSRR